MADIVFNISKGAFAYYSGLPAASDALIAVPLESSGLVTDATMRDYDTLDAILAGTSNEQTTATRKTLTSVVVTVDDTNDRVDVDSADISYTGLTGNAIGALVICYDGDTGTGTDANITPLTKHDLAVTPDGSDVNVAVTNFARAS